MHALLAIKRSLPPWSMSVASTSRDGMTRYYQVVQNFVDAMVAHFALIYLSVIILLIAFDADGDSSRALWYVSAATT